MRLHLLLSLALAACAGQTTDASSAVPTTSAAVVQSHSAANPAIVFERYRTFAFGPAEGPPAGYQMTARSAEVQRRLQPLIAAALTQKGYVRASGRGDLTIMFGSGRRELSTHESSSVGEEWLPDDENADFVEGAIVIDAFDSATGQRAWHGASQASIDPDRIDDQRLGGSVQELISSFPAASTR